jgi:D-3-phosphoglycerate dehydrogenase
MRMICWGSEQGRAQAAQAGEDVASSRAAFFSGPDIISLRLRLTDQTVGILTPEDLGAMGPHSVLVNTSRTGLIAPGALLAALNAGQPGRVALDVFDTEPIRDPFDPLVSYSNVIFTPHIGFVTEYEFDLQFAAIYDQVNAFASGQPIHMVNLSVWSHP